MLKRRSRCKLQPSYPEFLNSPGDFRYAAISAFRADNASQPCGLRRSYFVAGVFVVLLVVVLVVVLFFSEELQPANVKAASTRTADSVRTNFLMIIPLRHIIWTICLSDVRMSWNLRCTSDHDFWSGRTTYRCVMIVAGSRKIKPQLSKNIIAAEAPAKAVDWPVD
jgi:hypothetical protein